MKQLLIVGLLMAGPVAADPLYPHSVISNDLVFIDPADGSSFSCLAPLPSATREMPDKRRDELFVDNVTAYTILFLDGVETEIWLHPDLPEMKAELIATQVGEAFGRLPTFLRKDVTHITVNAGDETGFAEDRGRFFTLYADNITKRLTTRDLEATLLHETVHAVLDIPFAQSQAWRDAQAADGDFITDYAAENPDTEDLAESALFAFSMLMFPGELPVDVEAAVRATIPNRLAVLEDLFTANLPVFTDPVDLPGCLP